MRPNRKPRTSAEVPGSGTAPGKVDLARSSLHRPMNGSTGLAAALPRAFPRAPLYTLLHQPGSVSPAIESRRIVTSWLQRLPAAGLDANGQPLQCRATTRRGTPCQRVPLHHNGYCPSHQHLAETEEMELEVAA